MIGVILGSLVGTAINILLFDVQSGIAVGILIGQLGTVVLLHALGYIKT